MRTAGLWSVMVLALVLSGCALTHPVYDVKTSTPVDWGLADGFENVLAVKPFICPSNAALGTYAARRMHEYLLEKEAFRRVVLAGDGPVYSRYVLEGEIQDIYYGGTNEATRVSLNVRIIDRTDGHTRFFRKAAGSVATKGVSLQWLQRYYAPAPLPEEVLTGMLETIAADIAERTAAGGAKKCP